MNLWAVILDRFKLIWAYRQASCSYGSGRLFLKGSHLPTSNIRSSTVYRSMACGEIDLRHVPKFLTAKQCQRSGMVLHLGFLGCDNRTHSTSRGSKEILGPPALLENSGDKALSRRYDHSATHVKTKNDFTLLHTAAPSARVIVEHGHFSL